MSNISAIVESIAAVELNIHTLSRQGSDRLDFHDCSVWSIRSALETAYRAGAKAEHRRLRKAIRTLIASADTLIAAIDGTTGQFEPEVSALSTATTAAERAITTRQRRPT